MTVSSLALPKLAQTTLPNGLKILTLENPVADIVSARLFIRAGSNLETESDAGLTSFMMGLLTKGTHQFSSMDIAEMVESVGASLSTDASADYSVVSLKTVSADFPEILKLAAALLRDPSFPQAEIDLEQRLTLQQIRSMQEQPFTVAFNQLLHRLYGNHPYARPGIGLETSVAALTQAQLKHFHQQHIRPDNLVITIVGRIDPEAAITLVEQVFGDWDRPADSLPALVFPQVVPQTGGAVVPQDTNQSVVMVGYLAPAVKHDDYAGLKLINTYLGNGLSSRLFVELREKRGLAYDVSAFYPTRLDQSQFVVYLGTSPENTATALDGLRYEVERLIDTSLTVDELQAAKNKLLGQYALGKQTNAQIAQLLGWYEILGLGIEFDQTFQEQVTAVSVDELQTVAQNWFQTPYISLLGPEAALQPFLE